MNCSDKPWRLLGSLMVLAGLVATVASRSLAGEAASLRDRTWTWGYTISGPLPGNVPFVGPSTCSLEAGAKLLGTPNVVFMNSADDGKTLTVDGLAPLASCGQFLCALQHGAYAESAGDVSVLSQRCPSIVGGLIDDFLEIHGPSKAITPQETQKIHEALKSKNPALRLYVVRYTHQDQRELLPFLPYFDAINLWVWEPQEKPWRETIEPQIDQIRELTNKPILLGLFLHDYSKDFTNQPGGMGSPVPLNIVQLQTEKAMELTRSGKIEGFVILQSGWFHHEDHQPQVQWLRQYLRSMNTPDTTKQ